MIHYVTGTDLWLYPNLARTMFADRATQFYKQFGWPVSVDRHGHERDLCDQINPIYIILSDGYGNHSGSLRLLPTTSAEGMNVAFPSAFNDGLISDRPIWHCTRFCLSPAAEPNVTTKLFASAGRLMQEFQIRYLLAILDWRMMRQFRISGVPPELLGNGNIVRASMMTGLWQFDYRQLSNQKIMRLVELIAQLKQA